MKEGFFLRKKHKKIGANLLEYWGLPFEHIQLGESQIGVRANGQDYLCFLWTNRSLNRLMRLLHSKYPKLPLIDCNHGIDLNHYHRVSVKEAGSFPKLLQAVNAFSETPVSWCCECVDTMNELSTRSRRSAEFNCFMICAQRKELDWMPQEIIWMIAEYLLMPKFPALHIDRPMCKSNNIRQREELAELLRDLFRLDDAVRNLQDEREQAQMYADQNAAVGRGANLPPPE